MQITKRILIFGLFFGMVLLTSCSSPPQFEITESRGASSELLRANLQEIEKPAQELGPPQVLFSWNNYVFANIGSLAVDQKNSGAFFYNDLDGGFYRYDLHSGQRELISKPFFPLFLYGGEVNWSPDCSKAFARQRPFGELGETKNLLIDFTTSTTMVCPPESVWIGWRETDGLPLFWGHKGKGAHLITLKSFGQWEPINLSEEFPGDEHSYSSQNTDYMLVLGLSLGVAEIENWFLDFSSQQFLKVDGDLHIFTGFQDYFFYMRGGIVSTWTASGPRMLQNLPNTLWLLAGKRAQQLFSWYDDLFEILGPLGRNGFLCLIGSYEKEDLFSCSILSDGGRLTKLGSVNNLPYYTQWIIRSNFIYFYDETHIYRVTIPRLSP